MIQMRTVLNVADNTGAKKIAAIKMLGGSTAGQYARIGDVITASVKEAAPDGTVKKGAVVKAVIVRTVKETRRRDGSYIKFDDNAAVLINDANEPVGHARVRSGRPRAARAEVHEDHLARARSHLRRVTDAGSQKETQAERGIGSYPDPQERRGDRHHRARTAASGGRSSA